jgi:hypothetical protein
MERCSFQNEKAPFRGFLTLAHAGDPTPVTWINYIIAICDFISKQFRKVQAIGGGETGGNAQCL